MNLPKEVSRTQFLATRPRITPYIHRTPVLTCQTLNRMTGAELFFKCENFQKMGAFKMRGGANAILQLSPNERAKGVATHSSGNFAQAVALTAQLLGIPAFIVMPETAPDVKKEAVKGYGAEVIECPPNLLARESTLARVVAKTGATPLHPYDDYDVINGQGTAAQELLEEVSDLEVLIAPVGGGGLLAGTALAAHYLQPNITVWGAEPEGADDAHRSFRAGERLPQLAPNTIADGLLTSVGERNFPLLQALVSDILLVNDEEIIAALRLILERMKIIIEPSCAVPLAAVLRYPEHFAGKRVGVILSGGNTDLSKLMKLFS